MTMNDCFAKSYCKGFGREGVCNLACVGYHQTQTLFNQSNLPKRYQPPLLLTPKKSELDTFKRMKNWIDVKEVDGVFHHSVLPKVQDGEGLYMWGDSKGNGKTSWGAKILHAYIRAVAMRNNFRPRVLYVNVPEFLEDCRRDMDEPSQEHANLVKLIKGVDLVMFDDIGAEKPTDWVREQLYIIINTRYSNKLSTIFTSNVSLANLSHPNVLGGRIASRIKGMCEVVEMVGHDRRLSNGGTEK